MANPTDASYNNIFGDDLNLLVKTGVQQVNQPGVSAKIVGVRPGAVDVQLPDGSHQTLTNWNGHPITQQVLHKDGSVTTGLSADVGAKDMLDQKGHAYQAIDLSKATTQQSPTTATVDQLARNYMDAAQSSDPSVKKWFLDWQDKMIGAGFLDPKKYTRGLPDDATLSALNGVLTEAYRTSQTPDEVVSEAAAANQSGDGSKKVVRDYHLTSPEDLKSSLQKAGPDLIGMQPTPDQMAQISAAYNAIEYANQTNAFDARDQQNALYASGDTGASLPDTITYNAPNVDNYVKDQLRQQNPVAANGMAVGHYLSEFMSLLSGGGQPNSNTFQEQT